jgi:DNA-binding winged helix-turn-helix (wHTH) protein
MALSRGMPSPSARETIRFGEFELDVGAYELRRQGRPVRLERRPMDLLILLVSRPRELVSRAEIVERLWGNDVFVDVDTGVNTAIRKIRHALRDSPRSPTFIETVSGKGYRFAADVQLIRTPDVRAPVTMLAVLPFVNLTGDPEREYLADGLTEDTIASRCSCGRMLTKRRSRRWRQSSVSSPWQSPIKFGFGYRPNG